MYISSSSFPLAYNSIISRARSSVDCTTHLLVAQTDVDALCAARLLSHLLHQDEIVTSITPISGNTQLKQLCTQLQHNKDLRSLILINLGALLDLPALFDFLDDDTTPLIHVIDSHRPIDLANLFDQTAYGTALFHPRRLTTRLGGNGAAGGGEQGLPPQERTVVVWCDAEEDQGREGVREAWEAMRYEPDSASSDSSDSDPDSDGDLPRPRPGRGRSEDDDDEEDDDDDDDDDEGEEEEQGDGSMRKGRKRRRRRHGNGNGRGTSAEPRPLTRLQRQRHRARLVKYQQSGAYFGQSVAGVVYLLAIALDRAEEDAVWLAILGLTYQFTTNIIDRERYEGYITLLSDEVARLSLVPSTTNVNADQAQAQAQGPDDRSIRPSEELRFCLFRHWNLYDSMYHSGYLGSRMKLWTERGRRNLSGMLAKMGCPLSESSETYQHMATDLKLSLFSRIAALAPEYGLHDLIVPSFLRKSGYRTDLSAGDTVEALGALLEVATGVRLDFGNAVGGRRATGGAGGTGHAITAQNGGREEWKEGIKGWVGRSEERLGVIMAGGGGGGGGAAAAAAGQGKDEQEVQEEREEREKEWKLRNFWLAWDALDNDTTLLRSALPLSMALHRAIMDQGGYILEKQSIKSLRTYRLAVINEGPDLAVFRHPATLMRLALWLVDAVRDLVGQGQGGGGGGGLPGRKQPKSLPFVLASLNEDTDYFLVCGIVGAVEYGDVKKNSFAQAFQKAALSSNSTSRHDSFEGAVVEIRRDHLDKFLKELAMA